MGAMYAREVVLRLQMRLKEDDLELVDLERPLLSSIVSATHVNGARS